MAPISYAFVLKINTATTYSPSLYTFVLNIILPNLVYTFSNKFLVFIIIIIPIVVVVCHNAFKSSIPWTKQV